MYHLWRLFIIKKGRLCTKLKRMKWSWHILLPKGLHFFKMFVHLFFLHQMRVLPSGPPRSSWGSMCLQHNGHVVLRKQDKGLGKTVIHLHWQNMKLWRGNVPVITEVVSQKLIIIINYLPTIFTPSPVRRRTTCIFELCPVFAANTFSTRAQTLKTEPANTLYVRRRSPTSQSRPSVTFLQLPRLSTPNMCQLHSAKPKL